MLCTIIWDAYINSERREIWLALCELMPADSPDWSRYGVYAFWDPDTHELLYVGLTSNLPERFAQHNRLVQHSGGNKAERIDEWFSERARLGFTILIQGAAVQMLETLGEINPMLGVQRKGITQIAEGQLIELHKLERGCWPPWNSVGGSVRGAEWANPNDRSVIRLLSAAEDSLFVARRSIRALVRNEQDLRREAFLQVARMQALMEIHEMDFNFDMSPNERVEKISRMLMLIDGKLIDDLSGADDRIRAWVGRFADPQNRNAQREEYRRKIQEVASAAAHDEDRQAAFFTEAILSQDDAESLASDASDVLAVGYLDNHPELN